VTVAAFSPIDKKTGSKFRPGAGKGAAVGERGQVLRKLRARMGAGDWARRSADQGRVPGHPDSPARPGGAGPVQGWRRAFLLAVDLIMHRRLRLIVAGRDRYPLDRPALILTNHRRDADGPLVASLLLDRKGLRFRGPLPHFVAREDLLNRGFLRRYLTAWPRWVRSLLGPFDLGPFLRALQVHPMRRFPEQTLGEVLAEVRQVCGDLPLEEVLRPRWLARFRAVASGAAPPLRVSQALQPRYRPLLDTPYGLRRLRLACFRRIKPRQQATVAAQVREVLQGLQGRGPVHFVPEGQVSPHGGTRRFREGTHRLLAAAEAETALLPLGLIHDDMNAGRPRVYLALGEELPRWRDLAPAEAEGVVRAAIQGQIPVAMSQLASARLLELGDARRPVTTAELDDQVAAEAERFHARGARVDPLLRDAGQRRRRLAGFLRYCRRHRLITAHADGYRLEPRRIGPPDPWRPEGRLRYAANEHADLARYWGLAADRSGPACGAGD